MLNGILAIIIAYLIGSFPTAYLITRLRTGKDIRTFGSGNVGAHNVYEHIGKKMGILTGIIDVVKGILAIIVAQMLILNHLNMGKDMEIGHALFYIMGAALAVVIGHIWPITLKFKGGNGIATTIGILLMLMTREVLIAILVALLLVTITRNPILSINISLLGTIPIAGSLMHEVWYIYLGFSLILIAILVANFVPTVRAALAKAGNKEKLTAELFRFEQEKLPGKKGKKK